MKFCGLSTAEQITHAHELGATHIGLVVQAPQSHRNLALEDAADLLKATPAGLTTVLVTPSKDAQALEQALAQVPADVLQASGEIDAASLSTIATDAGCDAWKTIGLADSTHQTVDRVDVFDQADAIVLDAVREGYGGHGETIHWGHAFEVQCAINTPIVLAGGLGPDNVADAIDQVDPWCVDVSSGIETDEEKDPEKMRAFIKAVDEEVGS